VGAVRVFLTAGIFNRSTNPRSIPDAALPGFFGELGTFESGPGQLFILGSRQKVRIIAALREAQ
jgi:hypothetical protein